MMKKILQRNRVMLTENADYRHFRDHLIQEDVLTSREIDIIDAETVRFERMTRFLDILSTKPDFIIRKFCDIIRENDVILYHQLKMDITEDPFDMPPTTGGKKKKGKLATLQDELEDWYLNTLSRLHPIPWCEWLELELDHVFTNLEVVPARKHQLEPGGERRGRNEVTDKSAQSDGPKAGILLDADTMQKMGAVVSNAQTRVISFVEGPAGIGKSTLCRHLVYQWAKNNHCIQSRHFDLVLILEAKSLPGDLKRCITEQLFPDDFKLDENTIYKYVMKCEGRCLLIVDGVDELTSEGKTVVQKLLNGKLLRHTNLLLTGRPESARDYVRFANVHLVLKGFTYENVESYICKYFNPSETKCRDKLLNRIKNDFHLQKLATNPFTTLLLCLLVQDHDGDIPSNPVDIYEQVIEATCKNYLSKIKETSKQTINITEQDIMTAAGNVAYDGFKTESVVFTDEMVILSGENGMGQHLLNSGIFNRDFTLSRLHSKGYCYFPHKSFQEYLCARMLSKLCPVNLEQKLIPLGLDYRLNMFRFLLTMLAKDEDKIKTALRSICCKMKRVRYLSFLSTVESLRWVLLLAFDIKTDVDIQDFMAKIVSKSDRLNRAFCYGTFYKYWAGTLLDWGLLVLQKMVLRPVVVVHDDQRLKMRIGERCGRDVCHFFRQDKELSMITAVQFYHCRELLLVSHGTRTLTESLGKILVWPCVHSETVQAAIALLEGQLQINLLTVTLIPSVFTCQDLVRLKDCISCIRREMTVLMMVPEHPHDDWLYARMFSLFKSQHSSAVQVRFYFIKPYRMEVSTRESQSPVRSGVALYDLDMVYVFRSSVHQLYYDTICPY